MPGLTGSTSASHRQRRWLAAAVVALLGVAAAVLVPRLQPTGRPAAAAGGAAPSSRPSAAGTPAPSPTRSATAPSATRPAPPASSSAAVRPSTAPPAQTAGFTVPSGWVVQHDPTGFSVAVPAGWHQVRQALHVDYQEPGGGRYLRVDQTNTPAGDPLTDWQHQEVSDVANGVLPGYQRIGIARVGYRGWPAADWQFTWGSPTLHVLSRNLVTSPHQAYALYWSVPDDQWAASRPMFTVFAATFQPAP